MRKRWWEHSDWFGGGGASDSEHLRRIERKVDAIMATLDELNAALSAISTEVDKVSADTDNLLAQLAAITPGAVTQAQLDALTATAQGIATRLKAVDDKVPDLPPPPAPTPAP